MTNKLISHHIYCWIFFIAYVLLRGVHSVSKALGTPLALLHSKHDFKINLMLALIRYEKENERDYSKKTKCSVER